MRALRQAGVSFDEALFREVPKQRVAFGLPKMKKWCVWDRDLLRRTIEAERYSFERFEYSAEDI